jgi:hypothetical protein
MPEQKVKTFTEEQAKAFAAVYLMLNEELREGNFLVPRYHRITGGIRFGWAYPSYTGVVHGTHLDIAVELMEAGEYFGTHNLIPTISCFMYEGKMSPRNASIKPAEGLANVIGEIVRTEKGYEFKPQTFAEKPFLNDLRSQEGFVKFARTLRLEDDGITLEDGFLRLYGNMLPPERKERAQSTPLADIAKRLYEKAAAAAPAEAPKGE